METDPILLVKNPQQQATMLWLVASVCMGLNETGHDHRLSVDIDYNIRTASIRDNANTEYIFSLPAAIYTGKIVKFTEYVNIL